MKDKHEATERFKQLVASLTAKPAIDKKPIVRKFKPLNLKVDKGRE